MKDDKGSLDNEALPAYLQYNSKPRRKPTLFVRLVSLLIVVVLGAPLIARTLKFIDPTIDTTGFTSFFERPGRHHGHHKRLFGKKAEAYFMTVPNPDSCMAASRLYAGKPHMAGSDGDLDTAKEFLYLLQNELGIKPPINEPVFAAGSPESQSATLSIPKAKEPSAWIDIYYPVMNTPLDRALQAIDKDGKVVWEADLEERADNTDVDAGKYSQTVPTFHGLSADGDVSGKLIHANYGTKEDYDALVAQGVDFNGSIVLVRYGGNFRGLKIKGAQEVGAAGVLIYSDPKDDGTVTIENGYDSYPNGPARNPKSVQRGSVQYLSMYPGDPTTPGTPAYENATRTEGENIPKIPSLPISWENAETLLKKLGDGKGWEGGTVRLVNHVDTKVTPIWNTMGVIPGIMKHEVVVIGNHRDAWVLGAADPTSGTASIHETIRGLGALLKRGWKPLRTIVIASWDAEEYGLIGSTEWGEDFPDFIDKHVVAYLNLDGSASGSRFSAQSSPLLAHLVQQSALEVPHPTDPEKNLWDARFDTGTFFGLNGMKADAEAEKMYNMSIGAEMIDELGVGVLGSGSDFTVFLQRLGVASMGHGFGTTSHDAVYHYHSIYDSETWMEKYGDPGFFRHVAVAKHLGLMTLRVASSLVLPLNTTHYAFELEAYLDKVEALVSSQSLELDLTPLRQSIHNLQAASRSLDFERLVIDRRIKKIADKIKKRRSKWRKLKRKIHKRICKLRKKLGHPCKKRHGIQHGCQHRMFGEAEWRNVNGMDRVQKLEEWKQEVQVAEGVAFHLFNGAHSKPKHPRWPGSEIREVARMIVGVNRKLTAFERGFISEGGIPDREWYKHLGVAPGKWLGYGATTLPALTESITIEKNATLAKYEMGRLKEALDGIAATIAYRGEDE